MKGQSPTFLARDGANTLISLTPDGELVRGDQHINDLSAEELRHIIKKLVDVILKMNRVDDLSERYKLGKTQND